MDRCIKSEWYPHINSMIVHYEIPSFVFGDKTVSTVILGWPNPKSRPSRPSLIGLLPYCCVPCPQSPFTGRPNRSGPEHKNRKKHIGHGARFNDYTPDVNTPVLGYFAHRLSVSDLVFSAGLSWTVRVLEPSEVSQAVPWVGGPPSPPGTNGTTRASRAVPISNSPMSKGLLPDPDWGERVLKFVRMICALIWKGIFLNFGGHNARQAPTAGPASTGVYSRYQTARHPKTCFRIPCLAFLACLLSSHP